MSALRSVSAVLSADLRQRARTPQLWLLIAGLAVLMWWSFPAANMDYLTVSFGDRMRGRYSSAWIGMVVALLYSSSMSLAGFYLVRGTVVRDLETRVWQLLVATTMSRAGYLMAKWLSHMVIFMLVMSAGLLVGLIMQWVRAEDLDIDLIELLKPTVVLTLPSLAVTATMAVWFDLVPWLRRTAGNVVYFILWAVLLSLGLSQASNVPGADKPWPGDQSGVMLAEHDFSQAWSTLDSASKMGLSIGSQALEGKPPVLADWTHWTVNATDLTARGFWLIVALILLAAAVPLLDRFAAHVSRTARAPASGARMRWLEIVLVPLQRSRFGALVAAEIRLALRRRRAWWWLALLVMLGIQAFAPVEGMAIALVITWVWVLDIFARLILREHETRTTELVFTAPAMRLRLLAARVLVGVGLAWLLALPTLLRMLLVAPHVAAAALVVGLSLVIWGMAIGALSRNGRLFELLLLAAAYISLQGAWVLNVWVAPMTTLRWHLWLLPLALGLLVLGWRGITTERR